MPRRCVYGQARTKTYYGALYVFFFFVDKKRPFRLQYIRDTRLYFTRTHHTLTQLLRCSKGFRKGGT